MAHRWLAVNDGTDWIYYADDANPATWVALSTYPSTAGGTVGSQAIAYDETVGRWIVATYSEEIFTSSDDGATWDLRYTQDAPGIIAGIAFNGTATWVAVAANGYVYRSTDNAITWARLGTRFTFASLYGIGYGNGLFVAVGTLGDLYTSSDAGATWTARTAAHGATIRSVAYNGTDTYVYVGASSSIATSPDAVTWTARTSPTSSWEAVIWDTLNGQFIAGGSGGVLATSPDGITWTARTSQFGSDAIKALGVNDTAATAVGWYLTVSTSTDGATWVKQNDGGAVDFLSVAPSPGAFVEEAPALSFAFSASSLEVSDPLPALDLAFTAEIPGSKASSSPPAINLAFAPITPIDLLIQAIELAFTAQTPGNPILTPLGTPTRMVRLKFNLNAVLSYSAPATVTVSYRYGASSYLSVSLHNPSSTLLEAITAALAASQTATMTLQTGWRIGGVDSYQDQLIADIEDVRTDQGATSFSATLSGYNNTTATLVPKEYAIRGAQYIRAGSGAASWRGAFDGNVAPGDRLTLEDATTLVVGLISYTIQSDNAQMDITELTDADQLALLPW